MTTHTQTGGLNNDFRTCLAQLMEHGLEAHPRGTTTKELLNYNITLTNPRNRVITFADRNTSTKYLLGEFIWYANGSNLPDHILPYAKFWDTIRNSGTEPGYPKGTINSNYGNRLFGFAWKELPAFQCYDTGAGGAWPIDQWADTIKLLKRDKDTRQAIMNIHVPSDRHEGNKDVPCTLTLHWFIRDDHLCLIVNMRSNDVILGFTNDVFQFTMLQEAMLVNLKEAYPDLELGYYFHNAGSMHIYDRHFDMAEKIIGTLSRVNRGDPNVSELEMIPMDRFDKEIALALGLIQQAWIDEGMKEDFDFSIHPQWSDLTPYWQTLIKAFFNRDDAALHQIFGQTHE